MDTPKSFIPDELNTPTPDTPASFTPDVMSLDELLTPAPETGIFGLPLTGGENAGQRLGIAGQGIAELAIGAAKGLGSTLYGIPSTIDKLTGTDFVPDDPEVLKAKNMFQKIGFGAEQIAEYYYTTWALKGVKAGIPTLKFISTMSPSMQKAFTVLGRSGLEGLGAGFIKLLQTEGDIKEAGKTAAVVGAVSAPFEFLAVGKEAAAKTLRAEAEREYYQALAPTTKENKILAEKIVPRLLKERVYFSTPGAREKLGAVADENIDIAGSMLDDAYANLPPTAKVRVAPILDKLEKLKQALKVPLEKVQIIAETEEKITHIIPRAAKDEFMALQNLQQELLNVASGTGKISPSSVRLFRQLLDNVTAARGKSFGLTGKESAALKANKAAANAIRNEFAKQFPELGAINAEFNFWSNVSDVVSATVGRTRGQHPLGVEMAETAGAAAGVISGGVGKAATWAIAAHWIKRIISSPGWKMTSAVQKSRLADAIVSGNLTTIINIVEGTTGALMR